MPNLPYSNEFAKLIIWKYLTIIVMMVFPELYH